LFRFQAAKMALFFATKTKGLLGGLGVLAVKR
jgi:hypothetical protein